MSDIDFEELDRAVNSLMGQQSTMTEQTPVVVAAADVPAATLGTQPLVNASPVTLADNSLSTSEAQPASATPAPASEASAPAAPLITRRGGRFMDVIPSTGGRVTSRSVPSAAPSREIAPLQPLTADVQPVPDAVSAIPIVPVQSPELSAPPTETISSDPVMIGDLDAHLSQASADVDPITPEQVMTMPTSQPEPAASAEETPITPDADPVVAAEPVEPAAVATPPLESPFLEGVAVDKRPLGEPAGMADLQQQISDAVAEELATSDSAPAEMPHTPPVETALPVAPPAEPVVTASIDEPTAPPESVPVQEQPPANEPWTSVPDDVSLPAEPPLVPEFRADILAVESESTAAIAAKQTAAPTRAVPSSSPMQPVVGGDIAPQYATAPADNPEPSAIFDAATEGTQTLQHPVKKKSGWMVLVWILLLVVVGVASGVAAWYFLIR